MKRLMTLWYPCLFLLASTCTEQPEEVKYEPQKEILSDWSILKLAIIKTETEYDSLAVGRAQDAGLYQITPVYVEEVNRLLRDSVYRHDDAFNTVKATEMFEIYQAYKNPEHDIETAIRLHNPNSPTYLAKVLRNMETIRTYERIRELTQ